MSASAEIKIYPSKEEMMEKAANEIVRLIEENTNKYFHIALAGGETPGLLYRFLNKNYSIILQKSFIHYWWGDERCVPPLHNESNYKMASDNLFSGLDIQSGNIHRIKGENDPDQEAERYAEEIIEIIGNPDTTPVFDLVLLGLGNDGHTASIFPDRTDLLNHDPICAAVKHPESGKNRITLTGKILNEASNIFFIVTGEGKSATVAKIMNADEDAASMPANHISSRYGKTLWFMDDAAAAGIE